VTSAHGARVLDCGYQQNGGTLKECCSCKEHKLQSYDTAPLLPRDLCLSIALMMEAVRTAERSSLFRRLSYLFDGYYGAQCQKFSNNINMSRFRKMFPKDGKGRIHLEFLVIFSYTYLVLYLTLYTNLNYRTLMPMCDLITHVVWLEQLLSLFKRKS
jgi:hypothetical protein